MIIGTTFAEYDYKVFNAISSWRTSLPEAKIYTFGDECRRATPLGAKIISLVDRIAGVPLLSDIFATLKLFALDDELIVYVNADICFFTGIDRVLEDMRTGFGAAPFLLTGRRTDMKTEIPLCWASGKDIGQLAADVLRRGKKLSACGADYFVFNKATFFMPIPAFAVGRTAFDNYLIYDCLARSIPVIDATDKILALHQKHKENRESRNGELAQRNRRLAKAVYPRWTPWDGWVNSKGVEKL